MARRTEDRIAPPDLFQRGYSRRSSMTRRGMLLKLGILLNGAAGIVLAVPIVRYLLSPVLRERWPGYESWLSLGPLALYPAGQTRLATFQNPKSGPADGLT